MSLFRDETGSVSMARVAFAVALAIAAVVVFADTFSSHDASGAAYTLLGTVFTFTAVWAAGPRMAQHLAGQIGKAVDAIRKAKAAVEKRRAESAQDHPGTEATP